MQGPFQMIASNHCLPDSHKCVHMCQVTSVTSDSVTLWTVSPPGSSVHEILPGKNTGVGCHALLQGGLPDPGIEPLFLRFPASACRFFTTNATWEVQWLVHCHTYKKKSQEDSRWPGSHSTHHALTQPIPCVHHSTQGQAEDKPVWSQPPVECWSEDMEWWWVLKERKNRISIYFLIPFYW